MKITVTRSAIIHAPLQKVWALLRDFNSHQQWHPAVAHSLIENDLDGDVVGGVRRFNLDDGAELREQLLHHSDRRHALTYSILDSSLPLFDYVASIQLSPVTDTDHTFWHWQAQFRAPAGRADELKHLVARQIIEAGFTGLRAFLAEATQATPARRPVEAQQTPATTPSTDEPLPSRAIVITAPDVMTLEDIMVAAPAPGQVRIRHSAMAVNPLDLAQQQGTPGIEGVGQIIDVGPQVNGLFPGDRVAYISRSPGAYATIRNIDAKACLPLPKAIIDTDAAALLKGVTAALLLTRIFAATTGATILIQNIANGLGHLLSQWAKSMDLIVMGTVASEEQAKFIRELGCDHPVVVSDDGPIVDEVMRITNGRGVDYWVHSGGARGLDDALACLARCGHCAVIDEGEKKNNSIDVDALRERSLTVSAPVALHYFVDKLYLQRLAHQLFAKIESGTIQPAVKTFPLSKVLEPHGRIDVLQVMGAVALISGE